MCVTRCNLLCERHVLRIFVSLEKYFDSHHLSGTLKLAAYRVWENICDGFEKKTVFLHFVRKLHRIQPDCSEQTTRNKDTRLNISSRSSGIYTDGKQSILRRFGAGACWAYIYAIIVRTGRLEYSQVRRWSWMYTV